jgi:hypothetical protein
MQKFCFYVALAALIGGAAYAKSVQESAPDLYDTYEVPADQSPDLCKYLVAHRAANAVGICATEEL